LIRVKVRLALQGKVNFPCRRDFMTQCVAEKVSRRVEHAADEVFHDLRQVRGQLGARAKDTAQAINDLAAGARDRTRDLTRSVARTAQDRPVTTVAIIAGVAVALGFLIGRFTPRSS
jgi:ElaB/YqjD/DUF883 family membrane-anchored ribosome-binding protein